MKIKLYENTGGPNDRWWWRLIGDNGEPLAHSEMYTTKQARDDTAEMVAKAMGVEMEAGT
jgi:uncharacterized protein YegP (UPF0339 family)